MTNEKIPTSKAFLQFHKAHPEVYDELLRMSLRLLQVGHKHYSIKSLIEVLRWERARIMGERDFNKYLINNNYTAFYARLLMRKEPRLYGFFILRSSVADGWPWRSSPTIKEVDVGKGKKLGIKDFG